MKRRCKKDSSAHQSTQHREDTATVPSFSEQNGPQTADPKRRIYMDSDSQETEQIVPIGELCNELDISTRTLRYWEEVGIIESVERQNRANRGYSPYMVRRIKFIVKLKDMGLTIKEMQHLYKIYGGAKETEALIPELVKILDHHIEIVDEKIANLSTLRKDVVEYRKRILNKQKDA